jgi:hypothetical protein
MDRTTRQRLTQKEESAKAADLRSLVRSDPRLSQLFQLSDQLDQLAEDAASGGLKTPNGNRTLTSERPVSSAAFSDDASSSSSSAAMAASTLPPPPPLNDSPLETTSSSAWQSRCAELEWSLQRFRDQAQNIRELLREKVSQAAKK